MKARCVEVYMICERCHINKGTVQIHHIEGNVTTDHYYCNGCAEELVDSPDGIKNMEWCLDTVKHLPFKVNYIAMTTCEKCGMSYIQFKKTGKLGCDRCYTTFRSKILVEIKRLQGYQQHVGRVPFSMREQAELKRKVEMIRKALKKAIEIEAFEDAAMYRDQIKALEFELIMIGE